MKCVLLFSSPNRKTHQDFQFAKENYFKNSNCISFLDILLVNFVNLLLGKNSPLIYTTQK